MAEVWVQTDMLLGLALMTAPLWICLEIAKAPSSLPSMQALHAFLVRDAGRARRSDRYARADRIVDIGHRRLAGCKSGRRAHPYAYEGRRPRKAADKD